jgi:hypothetical protein
MNTTDIVAWWGAIIATVVLGWDIYKWKQSGPKIRISVAPNMETYGAMPQALAGQTFTIVEVNNIGDRSTTITHLFGYCNPSLLHRLRGKKKKTFIIANPAVSGPLPYVLNPGEQWLGGIKQDADLERRSRDGYMYCGIYHSNSKKAIVQRLVIPIVENT